MRTEPFLGGSSRDRARQGTALTESQLIAELGRLYYLEDASKVELAKRFDLSRFKIARMLAKGRDAGIIRIEIHEPTKNLPEYADPLMTTLGLPLVRVVESHGSPSQVREAVGAMGAQLMREALEDGDVVGLGGGRTMHALSAHLGELPALTAVQLCGTMPSLTRMSPFEQIRSGVEDAGGAVHVIGAPLFAGSVQRRDSWVMQMGDVRDLHERLDLAVAGVGAWDDPRSEMRAMFPPAVRQQLDDAEPVGEMLGHWFSADGAVIAQDVTRMCVTTETYHLSAAPHVVVVASGAEKARAIMGVARSGLITGLVTDRETAARMLETAGAL